MPGRRVRGKLSIEEFPSVRPVEAPDDDRLKQHGIEIPQVHAVASAGLGFKRLQVGDDPAGLAAHVPEGSVAPNITFGVLGVALDRDRAEFVVSPYASRAPA